MSSVRPGTLGATRVCPHCKALVLQNASIAEPESKGISALKVEGTISHPVRGEQCEYCVVVSITNERGEKLARQVVGVGALQPGERHKYSFSVELMPTRPPGGDRRRS